MADQSLEVLEKLWLAGKAVRRLAERTLKVAADLSPADREEVRKSAAMLKTFSERLRELTVATDSSLAQLLSSLEEAMNSHLSATLETLARIALKTDDPDQPVN